MTTEENRFNTGVSTFLGADYITDVERTAVYDIAFLGVPFEGGASYRRGQSEAPGVLRTYSDWDRLDGTTYVDLNRDGQALMANTDRVADLGDLRIDESSNDVMTKEIIGYTGRIAASCLPVFIGGDHSITYSTFQGARSRIDNSARVGIVHFDAHFDVEDDYSKMPRVWHGNPFRTLIQEGHIGRGDLITVGVRGIVPKRWVDYAEDNGITYVTGDQVRRDKVAMIEKVQKVLAKFDAVYMTLDVDALDVAYCPGTGVPTSNGLTPGDVTDFTRILPPLIGLDIVEFTPRYDVNGQSAFTICEILYDVLAFRKKT